MTPGTLLFHQNFRFHDGNKANNILVCLGINGDVMLVAKTRSKGGRFSNSYGSQPSNKFPCFHIPKGQSILKQATWICLDEFYELIDNHISQSYFSKELKHIGTLENELLEQLLECVLMCEDVASVQKHIVNTARKNLHAQL
ncbi:MAG: hypothetical protein LBU76_01740 [Azoarcus sp.]|jgi:hypothetical protein|nr:hypothetical protein [Azoarcus sp.]